MKKFILSVSALAAAAVFVFLILNGVDSYYTKKLGSTYYDEIGKSLRLEKNQGLDLQERSLDRKDTVEIYGSSELSGVAIPTHPANFFNNKKDGFQINLIGRGYSQSIIHAINFEALGNNLKDKKVVIIISPQWFTPKGLTPEGFNMNFSELQFYSFMFDKNTDKNIKLQAAERVNYLTSETTEFGHIKLFAFLYSKNNLLSKAALEFLMPYYKFKYYLLDIKDKVNTYNVYKEYKGVPQVINPDKTKIDWNNELKKAEEVAKSSTTNNDFGIQNDYFDTYIKDRLPQLKDSYKNDSFLKSPEYNDLKLLMDICKEKGIKPLFVSVPVHGQWYDYCGFSKEDRAGYYANVKDMVSSYGFDIADLSQYENEKYFLKDIMHLGWKGWLRVDEAIDRYYYSDRK